MKKIFSLVAFTFLILASGPTLSKEIKESVVNGYKNRCIEVRTKNGQNENDVRSVCECEASVLSANFSTFEIMMAAAKKELNQPILTEEQIREFRQKIKVCEKR